MSLRDAIKEANTPPPGMVRPVVENAGSVEGVWPSDLAKAADALYTAEIKAVERVEKAPDPVLDLEDLNCQQVLTKFDRLIVKADEELAEPEEIVALRKQVEETETATLPAGQEGENVPKITLDNKEYPLPTEDKEFQEIEKKVKDILQKRSKVENLVRLDRTRAGLARMAESREKGKIVLTKEDSLSAQEVVKRLLGASEDGVVKVASTVISDKTEIDKYSIGDTTLQDVVKEKNAYLQEADIQIQLWQAARVERANREAGQTSTDAEQQRTKRAQVKIRGKIKEHEAKNKTRHDAAVGAKSQIEQRRKAYRERAQKVLSEKRAGVAHIYVLPISDQRVRNLVGSKATVPPELAGITMMSLQGENGDLANKYQQQIEDIRKLLDGAVDLGNGINGDVVYQINALLKTRRRAQTWAGRVDKLPAIVVNATSLDQHFRDKGRQADAELLVAIREVAHKAGCKEPTDEDIQDLVGDRTVVSGLRALDKRLKDEGDTMQKVISQGDTIETYIVECTKQSNALRGALTQYDDKLRNLDSAYTPPPEPPTTSTQYEGTHAVEEAKARIDAVREAIAKVLHLEGSSRPSVVAGVTNEVGQREGQDAIKQAPFPIRTYNPDELEIPEYLRRRRIPVDYPESDDLPPPPPPPNGHSAPSADPGPWVPPSGGGNGGDESPDGGGGDDPEEGAVDEALGLKEKPVSYSMEIEVSLPISNDYVLPPFTFEGTPVRIGECEARMKFDNKEPDNPKLLFWFDSQSGDQAYAHCLKELAQAQVSETAKSPSVDIDNGHTYQVHLQRVGWVTTKTDEAGEEKTNMTVRIVCDITESSNQEQLKQARFYELYKALIVSDVATKQQWEEARDAMTGLQVDENIKSHIELNMTIFEFEDARKAVQIRIESLNQLLDTPDGITEYIKAIDGKEFQNELKVLYDLEVKQGSLYSKPQTRAIVSTSYIADAYRKCLNKIDVIIQNTTDRFSTYLNILNIELKLLQSLQVTEDMQSEIVLVLEDQVYCLENLDRYPSKKVPNATRLAIYQNLLANREWVRDQELVQKAEEGVAQLHGTESSTTNPTEIEVGKSVELTVTAGDSFNLSVVGHEGCTIPISNETDLEFIYVGHTQDRDGSHAGESIAISKMPEEDSLVNNPSTILIDGEKFTLTVSGVEKKGTVVEGFADTVSFTLTLTKAEGAEGEAAVEPAPRATPLPAEIPGKEGDTILVDLGPVGIDADTLKNINELQGDEHQSADIAKALGIGTSTLRRWSERFSGFFPGLQSGKARRYTTEQAHTLGKVKELLEQGWSDEQVTERLAQDPEVQKAVAQKGSAVVSASGVGEGVASLEMSPKIRAQIESDIEGMDFSEPIKNALVKAAELGWYGTGVELGLAQKAGELAQKLGIPFASPAVEGFSHFLQGVLKMREGKTMKQRWDIAKPDLIKWLESSIEGGLDLASLIGAPELGVAAQSLRVIKDQADNGVQVVPDMVAGHIVRAVAERLSGMQGTSAEATLARIVGQVLEHMTSNPGELDSIGKGLSETQSFKDKFMKAFTPTAPEQQPSTPEEILESLIKGGNAQSIVDTAVHFTDDTQGVAFVRAIHAQSKRLPMLREGNARYTDINTRNIETEIAIHALNEATALEAYKVAISGRDNGLQIESATQLILECPHDTLKLKVLLAFYKMLSDHTDSIQNFLGMKTDNAGDVHWWDNQQRFSDRLKELSENDAASPAVRAKALEYADKLRKEEKLPYIVDIVADPSKYSEEMIISLLSFYSMRDQNKQPSIAERVQNITMILNRDSREVVKTQANIALTLLNHAELTDTQITGIVDNVGSYSTKQVLKIIDILLEKEKWAGIAQIGLRTNDDQVHARVKAIVSDHTLIVLKINPQEFRRLIE